MLQKKENTRSPEVQTLLQKKSGFILSYGNLLLIIIMAIGIIVTKEFKYTKYVSYNLKSGSYLFQTNNRSQKIFAIIPIDDYKKFNFQEKRTTVNLEIDGQIIAIGILGNQIYNQSDGIAIEVIMTYPEKTLKMVTEKSLKKISLKIGKTSLFDEFLSQFSNKFSAFDA